MRRLVVILVLALALTPLARADQRPFSFVYDTYPEGKGNVEYEQWVGWSHHSDADVVYFRHEFEIGLADNFDISVYLPSWHWEDSADLRGTRFDSIGVEAILYLSNPVTDVIGSGLYTEVNVGEHSMEFETKLLLHKDIEDWTFAYNLIAETEMEGIFQGHAEGDVEVTGELSHAIGVSYHLGQWRVGGEVLIESVFDNWSDYEHTQVFAGPTFSLQASRQLWFAVTPMVQLTSVEGEPDFNLRAIVGWEF